MIITQTHQTAKNITIFTLGTEQVQALTDILCSGYVVIAMKPVHQLQIRQIVHNAQLGSPPTIPPSYIRVCAVVWKCRKAQTDTHVRDQYTFCVVYDSHEM